MQEQIKRKQENKAANIRMLYNKLDKDGNPLYTTKNLNREISAIQYNILNLPDRIDIKNPVGEARNEYIFRSDGKKVRVIHR